MPPFWNGDQNMDFCNLVLEIDIEQGLYITASKNFTTIDIGHNSLNCQQDLDTVSFTPASHER